MTRRFLGTAPRPETAVDRPAALDEDNDAGNAVKAADLTPQEKQTIRKWARRRPKHFGEVGSTGPLSQAWIDGWVGAGRPAV